MLPHGQGSLAWFSLAALLGMALLGKVGGWARRYRAARANARASRGDHAMHDFAPGKVRTAIAFLYSIFSKYIYLASLTSYYTFYLISKFHLPVQSAQLYLFVFLGAVALGTILGGPIGDRLGQVRDLVFDSGSAAFHTGAALCQLVLDCHIQRHHRHYFGVCVPGHRGLRPGITSGKSGHDIRFVLWAGVNGGVAAALLGQLADHTSIGFVYRAVSFMPLLGLLTIFLPNIDRRKPVVA